MFRPKLVFCWPTSFRALLLLLLLQSLSLILPRFRKSRGTSHYPTERYESNYSPSSYGLIVGQTRFFSLGEATSLGEGKTLNSNLLNSAKKLTLCHILPERRGWEKWRCPWCYGNARGVIVIVVGNGHGDSSSNPGRDWLYFT